MAKRGRRRRRQARRFAGAFEERSRRRFVDETLSTEAAKERYAEYRTYIAEKEKDVLSRTIFVTQVRDLNRPDNLRSLREFMERNYGSVAVCKKTYFKGNKNRSVRFPPARVQFRDRRSAEKIFGGQGLLLVGKTIQIRCPLGYKKGCINVRPSEPCADMLADTLRGSVIELKASSFSLGHWFSGSDELIPIPRNKQGDESNEWVEVVDTAQATTIRVDISKRLIDILGSLPESREFARIRFKELSSTIKLCQSVAGYYSLIFRLKNPPRILFEAEPEQFERMTHWGCIPIAEFGENLGYRFNVPMMQLQGLFLHENFAKLKEFGVLEFESLDQAEECKSRVDGLMYQEKLESEVVDRLRNPKLQLLISALVGDGKFCGLHVLNEPSLYSNGASSNDSKNLLQILEECPTESLAVHALEKMLSAIGTTKYPRRLFQAVLLSQKEGRKSPSVSLSEYVSIPRLWLTPSRQLVAGFEPDMGNRVVRRFMHEEGFCAEAFLRVQVSDENGLKLFDRDLSPAVEFVLKNSLVHGITIFGRHYHFLGYSSSQLGESAVWMVCPGSGWTIGRIRDSLGDFSRCKSASKYAARLGQCFSTTVQGANGEDACLGAEQEHAFLRHCVIKDIYGDSEEVNCHSDGTGLISRDGLNLVLQSVPFGPLDPLDASIVQIRFGGAKGTLTAWNFRQLPLRMPSQLDDCLRPSMLKFDAQFAHIEVCSIGKRVPYFLNRNVILLLSYHEIPNTTFVKLQREMLDDLDNMLSSREIASRMVPKLSGPDSELRSVLTHMLGTGLSPRQEPFLFDCLVAVRSHLILGLRKKARILVDKGAVLVGGLDETGLLPEGTVYCELWNGEEYQARVGRPVLVTKHPVMHPGDVRMLLAVDIPELRGHRNCILFSQHGLRPEADKMSGSDLDGDEYAVTWDSRLFLKPWTNGAYDRARRFRSADGKKWLNLERSSVTQDAEKLRSCNVQAMDYSIGPEGSAPTASSLFPPDSDSSIISGIQFMNRIRQASFSPASDSSTISAHLIQHFLNHIRQASVGRICMLWLDHAASKGAGCSECLQLAKLHSVAVDYPKSGIPAVIPRELHLPPGALRAHWREIKGHATFHCEGVLGQLYDEVIRRDRNKFSVRDFPALAGRLQDKYGSVVQSLKANYLRQSLCAVYDAKIRESITRRYGGFLDCKFQLFADQERESYESDLLEIMNRYKIRSEGEVATGCIRKYHRLHKKRQHNFAEEVRLRFRELRRKYRMRFFLEILRVSSVSTDESRKDNSQRDKRSSLQARETEQVSDNDSDFEYSFISEDDDSDISSVELDSDIENDELDQDLIQWAESIAANKTTQADNKADFSALYQPDIVQRLAAQLAAAYYEAAYSPELRWRRKNQMMVLFSFPWLVADVVDDAV